MTVWRCALHVIRNSDNSYCCGCPADYVTAQVYCNCWGCKCTIPSQQEMQGYDFVIYDGETLRLATAQDVVNEYSPAEQQYHNYPNPFNVGGPVERNFDFDITNITNNNYETLTDDNGNEEEFICF